MGTGAEVGVSDSFDVSPRGYHEGDASSCLNCGYIGIHPRILLTDCTFTWHRFVLSDSRSLLDDNDGDDCSVGLSC